MRSLCAVLLATIVAASAGKVGAALIVVKVSGYEPILVPTFEEPAGPGGNVIYRAGTPELPFFQVTTPDWSVALSAEIDPDPSIFLTAVATNFTAAPTTFGLSLSTGAFVSPIIGASVVSASIGGSLTDGGNGSVSLTPVVPPPGIPQDGPDVGPLPDEILVVTVAEVVGGPYTNMGHDLGAAHVASVSPFSTIPYPTLNEGPTAGPVSPVIGWNDLRADINFTLAGGAGDSFASSMIARIDVIPELSSYWAWCLFSGVGVAVCWYQRRRKPA